MTKNAIIVLMCGSVASDERSIYFQLIKVIHSRIFNSYHYKMLAMFKSYKRDCNASYI